MNQPCTVLISSDGKLSTRDQASLVADLESKDVQKKRDAVKSCIIQMSNGKDMSDLLMTIIRFCVTVNDHELTKLLHIYWECAHKWTPDGKLKPEMILVCNSIMNNLKHANEYIRGCTLRFLCKIPEYEVIEPLVPCVKENLEHRHPYVRRNAVLCVYSIYKNYGDKLFTEAPEYIYEMLLNESDLSTRRSAFSFLKECKEVLAMEFLETNAEDLSRFGVSFQLVALELIRTCCTRDPSQKGRFIMPLFHMLRSESSSVAYESATTLISLSNAPSAVKASANTLIEIFNNQTDNNIKLVILSKLSIIIEHNCKLLGDIVMDILHLLKTPSTDIRKIILTITKKLINARNVNEVMNFLKNELLNVVNETDETSSEYRLMLIQSIHSIAVTHPQVADTVLLLLLEHINSDNGYDILLFVREMLVKYPKMQYSIIHKLYEVFETADRENVICVILWILSEFSKDSDIHSTLQLIYSCIGPLPLTSDITDHSNSNSSESSGGDHHHAHHHHAHQNSESSGSASGGSNSSENVSKQSPLILSDGTYATQSSVSEQIQNQVSDSMKNKNMLPLRYLLTYQQKAYLLSILSVSLSKLVIKQQTQKGVSESQMKIDTIECLEIQCELLRMSESWLDNINKKRIEFSINAILNPQIRVLMSEYIGKQSIQVYEEMLKNQASTSGEKNETEKKSEVGIDEVIVFKQLRDKATLGIMIDLDDRAAVTEATKYDDRSDYADRLRRVHQLTGSCDPVYCEAVVTMKDFDVIMDINISNRTTDTLTELNIELSVTGSFNVIDRPPRLTLAAGESRQVHAIIKVSCTQTGYIFGSITYRKSNNAEHAVINMNEIHISLMDYIKGASCSNKEFRGKWEIFDWENKVSVNTTITDLKSFVEHISEITHMNIISDISLSSSSCFLAANLYARSVFNEDVLLNISVEKTSSGIHGYYRIRSNTQGIALSLGEVIVAKQRKVDGE